VLSAIELILGDDHILHLAETGRTALEILSRERIDTVLLDLKLPDIHGIEVLRQIRRTTPQLPVIILTGNSDHETAKAAARLGVSDYLDKPFDAGELKEKIREVLLRGRSIQRNKASWHAGPNLASAAEALIRDRYAEKLTLGGIARSLGVSPRQLTRAFKNTCGITFKTYQARMRIYEAQLLLLGGNELIKAVMALVGYKKISHFYKDFHRFTGKTPGDFRRLKAILDG
jgi:YesN/AraC family two-component response regulator